jgi:surface antigen
LRALVKAFVAMAVTASLAGCGGASRPSTSYAPSRSAAVECAPYAREVSGIELYGDAADWWEEAAGRYARTDRPRPGAVLVFARSSRLPHGHVSVVRAVRSAREITVTQANWVHGRVASAEPVVDVSPGNDWTAVRVWWEPAGQLGSTVYPAFGFVTPEPPRGGTIASAQDGVPPCALAQGVVAR